MSGLLRMGGWIDAFRPAEGNPPQSLGAFFRWCLQGSWSQLWVASVFSALAGVTELVSAVVLGWLIDAAVTGTPATFGETVNRDLTPFSRIPCEFAAVACS